jgi:hypothetical protein
MSEFVKGRPESEARFRNRKEVPWSNDFLAPIEHLIIGSSSVDVNGKFLNTDIFINEIDATGKVLPEMLIPEALQGEHDEGDVELVNHARRSNPIEGSVSIFSNETQEFFVRKLVNPRIKLGPFNPRIHQGPRVWEVEFLDMLTSRRITGKRELSSIHSNIGVDDRWGKCLTVTRTEEDKVFAVFDPELAA